MSVHAKPDSVDESGSLLRPVAGLFGASQVRQMTWVLVAGEQHRKSLVSKGKGGKG